MPFSNETRVRGFHKYHIPDRRLWQIYNMPASGGSTDRGTQVVLGRGLGVDVGATIDGAARDAQGLSVTRLDSPYRSGHQESDALCPISRFGRDVG